MAESQIKRRLDAVPPRRTLTVTERCATFGEAEDLAAEVEGAQVLLQVGSRRYRGQVIEAPRMLSLRGGAGYVVNMVVRLEAVGDLVT